VTAACKKHGGFYLGSIGGPAARLAQDCIKKVEVLEYPELGMEAVWKIEVVDFPAFIVVDDKGNDFFAGGGRRDDAHGVGGLERAGELHGLGGVGGHAAVVEVDRERDEALGGEASGQAAHVVVEAVPLVHEDDGASGGVARGEREGAQHGAVVGGEAEGLDHAILVAAPGRVASTARCR
jgi:hypothetical protein